MPKKGELDVLDDRTPPEVRALVDELRTLLRSLGTTVEKYAESVYVDKGTVSRYLSGQRIPGWQFVETLLLNSTSRHGAPPTQEVLSHFRDLYRAALKASGAKARLLADELAEAEGKLSEAKAREQLLKEALHDKQGLINELERRRELADTRDRQRDDHVGELVKFHDRMRWEWEYLVNEIERLKGDLLTAHRRRLEAEERCEELERQLNQMPGDFNPQYKKRAEEPTKDRAKGVDTPVTVLVPQVLAATSNPEAALPDSAPPGTIFVAGPEGGYAVPPRRYTVLFGRDREEVHVPVGVDDPYVGRKQGVITGNSDGDWWLHNLGKLPLELPDRVLLLSGHQRIIEPGYTPVVILSPAGRHLVEVRLASERTRHPHIANGAPEVDPKTVYELSLQERLVITALAKRYLEGFEPYPLPLNWQDTASLANASPHSGRTWTARSVAFTVEEVRERLHRRGVRGLLRDEVGANAGPMLSDNLIRELLKTATLVPEDLVLLAEDDREGVM